MKVCVLLATFVGLLALASSASAHPQPGGFGFGLSAGLFDPDDAKVRQLAAARPSQANAPEGDAKCKRGMAAGYACDNVDLLAQMPLAELGGARAGNDMWGWQDPQTGREYALSGNTNGTAFVDVTDARRPRLVGFLPTQAVGSRDSWRDIKVYEDHAYVVSEHLGHGMQVFDLTRLREVRAGAPITFTADTVYEVGGAGNTHNLDINEDSGFAYLVGTSTCGGGLHMVDIRDPKNPTFAGCFEEDGYTHDSQCVIYDGPDESFAGREVCFASNEDTVTIVDVTDKANPEMISRTGYPTAVYTHQGWLTPDGEHFVFNDEGDENGFGDPPTVPRQTTYALEVDDLESPGAVVASPNNTTSIDHNLYMKGDGYVYESNYTSGLRIFTEESVGTTDMQEVAWFDVYPENDAPTFEGGTWSNYIWFSKGVVAVNTIDRGLFLLKPKLKNVKGAEKVRRPR
jgi:choice-of-anchor B domain-containing protein